MGDEKTVLNKRAAEKSKKPKVNSDLTSRCLLVKRYMRKASMRILAILKTILVAKMISITISLQ